MDIMQQQDLVKEPVISEEKRKLLSYTAERLKAKIADTEMRMSAVDNQVRLNKQKSLKDIFDTMKMNGVDLQSRESVSGYIEKLRQNNPETAQMFERSMEFFLSDDQHNMNNVNSDETLPQNVRGLPS